MLFADPKDVTVEHNQWVQFSCTARCDYPVRWYMAGHSNSIKYNSSVPGLLIKRKPDSKCTSNQMIHFFEVYATEAFNKSTFYCAAYERHHQGKSCSCDKRGRCYTRPALLTGAQMFELLQWVFCHEMLVVFLEVLSQFLLKLCCSCTHSVRMTATVNPPTQPSVTQTPSNCSTSGTFITQSLCIFFDPLY